MPELPAARCAGLVVPLLCRRPRRAGALAVVVAALAALAALAPAACAGSGVATPPAKRGALDASAAERDVERAAPARWIDASGATAIGPVVAGGTLVLVGGRRALVAADGAVRPEAARAPEPLVELVEVPTAAGARRLVGRGVFGVYRFDDPLGAPVPLARSEAELQRIGGGPGLVAIWDIASDLPRFVDVETGQPRPLPGLPAPPLRAVAFRDLAQGAGIFEAAGLAVTADGGATWRLVAGSASGLSEPEALRVTGLRLRDGALRAFAQPDDLDAVIDVAAARIAPRGGEPAPRDEAPLLRWIRGTGRDPLEAAIASGAATAGAATAVTASHGLLARLDVTSGLLVDLATFARGEGVGACGVGSAGRAAWIACALGEGGADRFYDPFGVLRVPLDGRLVEGASPILPALSRNGDAELRTSPSGGAMLLAPCNADEEGIACVRQASGKWLTIRSDGDILERGAGPLADGRIAIVRGLWDGDAAPDDDTGDGRAAEGEPARGPHVAILDAAGREHPLAGLGWPSASGVDLHVVSPIEEGVDGALSFVVAADDGELTAVVVPHGAAVSLQRLAGTTHAKINAGHGVAVGAGEVLVSTDAGRSWAPVPVPAGAKAAIARLEALLDEPGILAVNALGLKIDTQLRIGWGAAAAPPDASGAPLAAVPRPGTAGAPLLPLPHRAPPAPLGPERALVCTTQPVPAGAARVAPARGLPPVPTPQQIVPMLTKGARPPPKGFERKVSSATGGRAGPLDVVAVLEEQSPVGAGKGAAPPVTWTLRWFDPTEVQARVREWSGPAPPGSVMGATLRSVAASGDRALFAVRVAARTLLVRATPKAMESIEVDPELLPGSDVVFGDPRDGRDASTAIAWLRDTALIVWTSGAPPRPIASLSTRAARLLGAPTRSAVPLLLSSTDWSLERLIPLPPPLASVRPAPNPPASPPPSALPLDGWTDAPNIRREPTHLPACTARPKADALRFIVQRSTLDVVIDDRRATAQTVLYDVLVAPSQACIASVAALLPPDPDRPPSFLRADFLSRRAEGSAPPANTPTPMACALAPHP